MSPNNLPGRQDIAELREAVRGLGEQILALSGALNTVNDLQDRQIETEKKTALIEENAVTKEEAAAAAHQIRRVTLKYLAFGLVVFLIGTGAFVGGLLKYQHDQRSAYYKVCIDRNTQNTKVYSILRPDPTRPMTPAQAKSLAILKDAFAPIHCVK